MSFANPFLRAVRPSRTLQLHSRNCYLKHNTQPISPVSRQFSVFSPVKMPENPTHAEINSKTDPSVAKQYDDETPKEQQIKDLFNMIDGKKVSMLNTYRNGIG